MHLVASFDDASESRVVLLESDDPLAEVGDLLASVFVVGLECGVVDDACLLLDLEVLLLEDLAIVLHLGQRDLLLVEALVQVLQLRVVQQVLLLHILQLLTRVR